MGDFFQIGQMAVKQCGTNSQEVGMTGVIDLDNTPGILPSTDFATTDLNYLFRAHNSEWHKSSELGILLNGILVVLLDIIREVVNGNTIVFDIFHNKLLRFSKFVGCKGISSANDWNNVDARSETLHKLNIEFPKTIIIVSKSLLIPLRRDWRTHDL